MVGSLLRVWGGMLSRPGAWVATRWQLTPPRAALLQAVALGLLVVGVFVLLPALMLWGVQGNCSLLEAIYNPGIEPGSPALQADSLLTELQGSPLDFLG